VLKSVILVLVGGAVGAVLREDMMLWVPSPAYQFPLDILAANLLASLLLGLVTGLCQRMAVSEGISLFMTTGVTGGLSTFSSFAYGSVMLTLASLMSAVVASVYVLTSLAFGYLAVVVGLKLSGQRSAQRSR
jgi:fluoride exporter